MKMRIVFLFHARRWPEYPQAVGRQACGQSFNDRIIGAAQPRVALQDEIYLHPTARCRYQRIGKGDVAEIIGGPAYPAARWRGVNMLFEKIAQRAFRAIWAAEMDNGRGGLSHGGWLSAI